MPQRQVRFVNSQLTYHTSTLERYRRKSFVIFLLFFKFVITKSIIPDNLTSLLDSRKSLLHVQERQVMHSYYCTAVFLHSMVFGLSVNTVFFSRWLSDFFQEGESEYEGYAKFKMMRNRMKY